MLSTLRKFLKNTELKLNVDNTKILVFNKTGREKKKEVEMGRNGNGRSTNFQVPGFYI